jgi:CheY-like chemotaxis protein
MISTASRSTADADLETACDAGARVLVLDDNPALTRVLARALTLEGYDVTTCNHPLDALESIVGGLRFDLILCDVMMPRLTGVELFKELTRVCPEQARRLLFVTGGSSRPDDEAFLSCMPDRCLRKPFQLVDLLDAMSEVLGSGESRGRESRENGHAACSG